MQNLSAVTENKDIATKEYVDNQTASIVTIGDLKTSAGTQSSNWLKCNGAGINASQYPALTEILQTANPTGITITLPKTYYSSSTYHNAQGAWYYNGRRVVVCNGYLNSSSANHPVIYTTTDLYGEWTEVELAASGYFMVGVVYDSKWGDWVAYGYKYVSSSECYPYLFYTADPCGKWTGFQVSSTNCKITTGHYYNGKLVLLGKGCASGKTSYAYAYVNNSYAISFTENNYSTSHSQGIRSLAYGNGYWAYADNSTGYYYCEDPTGTWTRQTIASSGIQTRGIDYGNGTWCISAMQNSGGSGRMFYSDSISGTWTNLGVFDVNQYNDPIRYSDGVWLTVTQDLGGGTYFYVSTDRGRTWTKKTFSHNTPYYLYAYNGTFLLCQLYGIHLFRRPNYDAPLPLLSSSFGDVYVRAK